MPADQKLQSHTYSRLVEKFKKCYSEQGCQKFWSSRLIINSRWLWNLHQRHKFLRAEAFRDVLKFIESQKWHFQEFLRGIFHCWCHVVLSEYTHHSGNIAVEMSQAFHDVTQFKESNLFKYALNVIQTGNRCFTIIFDGAYFLLAVMVGRDESSRLRMAN